MLKKIILKIMEKMGDSVLTILIDLIVLMIIGYILPILIPDKSITNIDKMLALILILMIIYMIFIFAKRNKHRFKFHHITEHIIMEYNGDEIKVFNKYETYTRHFKANRMHVTRTWFSNENYTFDVITPGFAKKFIRTLGSTSEYYILFPKYYYFFKRFKFETVFTGSNKHRGYENFYWVDCDNPIDKLIIEVRIPSEYYKQNSKILLCEFLKYEDATGNKKKTVPFDGYYKWEIEKPKIHWSYKIEWEWSKKEISKRKK